MIPDRNELATWNARQQAARDAYHHRPITTPATCDVCGVLSPTVICDKCRRGLPRYSRADRTRNKCHTCGRRTWAESGVCRACQGGEA